MCMNIVKKILHKGHEFYYILHSHQTTEVGIEEVKDKNDLSVLVVLLIRPT